MSTVDSATRIAPGAVSASGASGPGFVSPEGFAKALAERSEARAFTGKTPDGRPAEMLSFGTGRNRVNVWNEGGQAKVQRPNGPASALTGSEVTALRQALKGQSGAYVPPNDRANAGRVRDFAAALPKPLSAQDFRRNVAASETPGAYSTTDSAGRTRPTVSMTPAGGGDVLNVWKEGNKTMASLGSGPERPLTQAERAQVKTRLAVGDRELQAALQKGPPPLELGPKDSLGPTETPAQRQAAFEAGIAEQRRALADFARRL